uniref:Uncharacterized protein n=1 Tax=Aquila chrysaetos chrysaetos TaxID=223781 RepID=A0A663EPB3_AQUCH
MQRAWRRERRSPVPAATQLPAAAQLPAAHPGDVTPPLQPTAPHGLGPCSPHSSPDEEGAEDEDYQPHNARGIPPGCQRLGGCRRAGAVPHQQRGVTGLGWGGRVGSSAPFLSPQRPRGAKQPPSVWSCPVHPPPEPEAASCLLGTLARADQVT